MCGRHGRSPRPRLAFFFWLALSLPPATSWASPGDPPSSIPSWKSELDGLKALSSMLLSEVSAQKALSSQSSALIAELSSKLEASAEKIVRLEASLTESGESIESALAEIAALKQSLAELQAAWKDWKKSSQEKIGRLERGIRVRNNVILTLGVLALSGWGAWAAATF